MDWLVVWLAGWLVDLWIDGLLAKLPILPFPTEEPPALTAADGPPRPGDTPLGQGTQKEIKEPQRRDLHNRPPALVGREDPSA